MKNLKIVSSHPTHKQSHDIKFKAVATERNHHHELETGKR